MERKKTYVTLSVVKKKMMEKMKEKEALVRTEKKSVAYIVMDH